MPCRDLDHALTVGNDFLEERTSTLNPGAVVIEKQASEKVR
jgi:hypothetical protein